MAENLTAGRLARNIGIPRKTVGLIVSVVSIPAGIWAGLVSYTSLWRLTGNDSDEVAVVSFVFGCCVFMFLWILGLRQAGKWTRSQRKWVCLDLILSILVGAFTGIMLKVNVRYSGFQEYVYFVSVSTCIVWCILTGLLLKPRRKRYIEQVSAMAMKTDLKNLLVCSKCNADMTSFAELVCPECGSSFVFDDLVNANAERIAENIIRQEGNNEA